MNVLTLVNTASSTSIPLEIAEKINVTTDADVTVVSLFDDEHADFDPDVTDFTTEVRTLGASSRTDIAAYWTVRHLLETQFDVFHTHQNATGSLARLAAVGTDTAVVDTEHNDHRYFSTLQTAANAVTFPVTDTIVFNSDHTRRSLRWYERWSSGWADGEVIYNGVDFNRIREGRSREPPVGLPSGPLVGNVGVATAQKDQATLLRAFACLQRDVPDASLVVVGDGPELNDLKTLASDLDIADSVVFTGYLPAREDVYAVLEAVDVFALTSRYEGFCVAMVEAFACHTPTIVSDLEVLREVAGESAFYAPVGDPVAFACRIRTLFEDESQARELADCARDRAHAEFPLERTATRYFDLYDRLT